MADINPENYIAETDNTIDVSILLDEDILFWKYEERREEEGEIHNDQKDSYHNIEEEEDKNKHTPTPLMDIEIELRIISELS